MELSVTFRYLNRLEGLYVELLFAVAARQTILEHGSQTLSPGVATMQVSCRELGWRGEAFRLASFGQSSEVSSVNQRQFSLEFAYSNSILTCHWDFGGGVQDESVLLPLVHQVYLCWWRTMAL